MKKKLLVGLSTGLLLSWGCLMSAEATTLFTEDFESYAAGSNLVGQGGWIEGYTGGSVLNVNGGTSLPTHAILGTPYLIIDNAVMMR